MADGDSGHQAAVQLAKDRIQNAAVHGTVVKEKAGLKDSDALGIAVAVMLAYNRTFNERTGAKTNATAEKIATRLLKTDRSVAVLAAVSILTSYIPVAFESALRAEGEAAAEDAGGEEE